MTLPKEINTTFKVGLLSKRLLYGACIFLPTMALIQNFEIIGFAKWFNYALAGIIAIMFMIDIPLYGNVSKICLNSLKYIVKKIRKNIYVYNPTKMEIIQLDGNKKKKKMVKLSGNELLEDILRNNKITATNEYEPEIGFYIKNNDETITTFIEIKINKLPRYFAEVSKAERQYGHISELDKAASDLSTLYSLQKYGRIITLTKKPDLSKFINKVDVLDEQIDQFKDKKEHDALNTYLKLQRNKIDAAKRIGIKNYYLEINGKNKYEVQNIINNIKGLPTFNQSSILNSEDYDYVINYLYKQNQNSTYGADYILSDDGTYARYISLERLGNDIPLYWLLAIHNLGFDYSIYYKEFEDIVSKIDKSISELKSRKEHKASEQIENQQTINYLAELVSDIKSGDLKVYNLDLIIKITANSYELLEVKYKTLESLPDLNTTFYLKNNYFSQDEYCRLYHSTNNKFTPLLFSNNYLIPSREFSYGYPFNFLSFMQPNGLLKCIDPCTILSHDNITVDQATGQSSYDMYVAGNKGSGKSTMLKEQALDTILMQGGKVVMFDYDAETKFLNQSFGGNYIVMGETNINILSTDNYDKYENNAFEQHLNRVYEFFTILIPEMNAETEQLIFMTLLRQYYENTNEIPTIHRFYTYVQSLSNTTNLGLLIKRLDNFTKSFPYFCNISDETYNFKNVLTSLDFSKVKDKNIRLLNAFLYWVLYDIRNIIQTNVIRNSNINLPLNDFINYINYYTERNNIDDKKLFEELILLKTNDNMASRKYIIDICTYHSKFMRVIIDEAHRCFKNKLTLQFFEEGVRENRKYNAGYTFASQQVADVYKKDTNSIENVIWTQTEYKLFFKLSESELELLISSKLVTPKEVKYLRNPAKGRGILKIEGGNTVYDYYTPMSKEMVNYFDGGK